jgi:hypothetical protein
MREGSYPRFFGFFAVLFIPGLAIRAISGEAEVERAVPALGAIPFGALVVMALISGSVWFADRDHGAYKISRAREPFWYWFAVGMWGALAAGFLWLMGQP